MPYPYAVAHKSRTSVLENGNHDVNMSFHGSAPSTSSRSHGKGAHFVSRKAGQTNHTNSTVTYGDEAKKDRKRKEIAGRLGKEMSDKKDAV